MTSYASVFGIEIADLHLRRHLSCILRFISKRWTLKDDYYTIIVHDDLICDNYDMKDGKITVPENDLKFTKFHYKEDPHIEIGMAHICAYMIYISRVDESISFSNVTDDVILNLIKWKQELIDSGRILADTTCGLICTCCTI